MGIPAGYDKAIMSEAWLVALRRPGLLRGDAHHELVTH